MVVDDPLRELRPDGFVDREDPAVLVERGAVVGPDRVVLERAAAEPDEHELVGQEVRAPELVEGRDDLAMREVARRPEEHERGRVGHALEAQALPQRVVEGLRGRLALALAGETDLADRPRGVATGLRARRRGCGRGAFVRRRALRAGRRRARGWRFLRRGHRCHRMVRRAPARPAAHTTSLPAARVVSAETTAGPPPRPRSRGPCRAGGRAAARPRSGRRGRSACTRGRARSR